MRRTLVIGGNLFIGRELVRRLLERGDEVTILHRSSRNPFAGSVRQIPCDRNDNEAVRNALRDERFEIVFDNVYDWQRGTSGEQVRATAEACGPHLERYVFMSSCAAYGNGLDLSEDAPLAGSDHPEAYCRNKADSERALFALHDEAGVAAVTLRPPFVYGPHNPFYREAFFWDRLAAGRPIVVPGDGSRLMQFVSVGDLAELALRAAESPSAPGNAYNAAHREIVRQDDFVRALGTAAGVKPDLRYVSRETIQRLGGQVFEPPLYFGQYLDLPPITMDVTRARDDLDCEPGSLADGLPAAFEAYRHSQRPEPDLSLDDALLAVASG